MPSKPPVEGAVNKLLPLVALVTAVIIFAPLAVAVVVVSILAPAAVSVIDCTSVDAPEAATGDWRPPFQQRYALTSPFGRRFHPIYKEWRLHTGQDLSSLPRAGPVVAASAAIVISADWDRDYGNIVSLRHGNRVVTRYGHLASVDAKIIPGARVGIGQRIGIEGSTGTSTGLHLHFQVEVNRTPVNPVRFMADRGAPLDGKAIAPSKPTSPASLGLSGDALEGELGFPLPRPGTQRRNSLHNPPLPIPPKIKKLYVAAAARYKLPWTLLAGIGMEETGHGRNNHTSSAGAQGLMQFMPATWATMGVDGDHDRRADIHNDADSIYSAANYLTKSGVSQGAAGVRKALFAYNPINSYVNDVLFYANRYGGGTVLGDPNDCGTANSSSRNVPPLTNDRVAKVLVWAKRHDGDTYRMGAAGPNAWDCSSFTKAAFAQIGIRMPRLASAQRSWMAAGNGIRIRPGQERRGDLIFWDSSLGPNQIAHVMIVWNPATKTTIEARSTLAGVGHFSYANGPRHHIFEIWRLGNVHGDPR
jgi:cell wall-associated NlpC family hydrolase